ncbi:RsmD family RNA methyltransferase [Campylobacter suis]|uniref:16S rRNA (Guanine(966)-N(2))-methyltransferase RsmD n=1 Tax=Campylobacter suis TaxID=2790657 RepID=A0ABM8Q2M6_9BACT|nr:RsmD family RNA methyltransferase [Campylobacter suis]CAD7287020.1 hypothetical protein LMG8286_00656 [Campylobacter suis]
MRLFATISTGKFKGKKIELPSLKTTRSTKSIVKGSFFDTVRDELYGKVFIEGFGGSALMACEAFSNGAKNAIAIEIDKDAFKLTSKNMASIDKNLKAIHGDSFALLPAIIASASEPVMLYLDPPFDIRNGFGDIYKKTVKMVESLDESKIFMIIFEHSSQIKFDEKISNFTMFKSKKFGATTLSYYS